MQLRAATVFQGIEGHGFYGNCVVPIIENTARECELTDRMRQAIIDFPQSNAVLVRRHGAWQRRSCSCTTQTASNQQQADVFQGSESARAVASMLCVLW